MSNIENGDADAIARVMAVIIQHSAYGSLYYICMLIVVLAAFVLAFVPGGTLQAELFRWAACGAGVFAFVMLIGLAIWDLMRGKRTRQKSLQEP